MSTSTETTEILQEMIKKNMRKPFFPISLKDLSVRAIHCISFIQCICFLLLFLFYFYELIMTSGLNIN